MLATIGFAVWMVLGIIFASERNIAGVILSIFMMSSMILIPMIK